MVKLTMIARVTDGLPLAEGLDDGRDLTDAEMYKHQVKALFKNLSKGHNEASRMSVETGPYVFQYPCPGRVCYLTMCDRSYPKKLAFQYLEDLKNEFERVNGAQIETAARPYAFIKFDTFIQKTKKLYQDTRTQRNISKLNDELYEVHQIMTRNVQEVLGVGEKLDQVSQMSSRLTSESRIYADKARDLNRQVSFNSEVGSGCHRVRSRVPPLLGESKAVVISTVLHGFNNSSSSFLGFSVLLWVACCPHPETKHWSELWFFVHHTIRQSIGTDLQCGIVKERPYLKSICSKTNYSFNMSKARIEQQIVN
ncbi:25.3 kDa vesicle transport protein-like [Gossypium australe]|uniref:25.3 kDa vesicle transport protein-like n=1 Tax=Gossypium australe TaxID=47621 RepID=A0A5B6WBX9_9ROSI|nr:25.3 kDa vesicle transport protein-like [Gossypium australe]